MKIQADIGQAFQLCRVSVLLWAEARLKRPEDTSRFCVINHNSYTSIRTADRTADVGTSCAIIVGTESSQVDNINRTREYLDTQGHSVRS